MRLVGTVLLDNDDRRCGRIIPLGHGDYCVYVEPDGGKWGRFCDPRVPTLEHALITAQDAFDEITGGYCD